MSKLSFKLIALFTFFTGMSASSLQANASTTASFSPFTAKVTRSKVRIRLEPSIESPILKEVENGEMVVVVGEAEEFYALLPPEDTQAYIFRTFVLDDVVEGNKVNIRLCPTTDAPVIAQLNSGDRIQGEVCPANSKWLKIPPPQSVRFYIAKDYVEKIGPADLMQKLKKRKQDASALFEQITLAIHEEFQKPYDQMHVESYLQKLSKLQADSADFPEIAKSAREALKKTQENYLHKKIAFLESKASSHSNMWQTTQHELTAELEAKQDKLVRLEEQIAEQSLKSVETPLTNPSTPLPRKQTALSTKWSSLEQRYFQEWAAKHQGKAIDEYYHEQEKNHVLLSGILEPYTRSLKNKPGDFLLVDPINHLPIAYLYSTKAPIHDKIGQSVTVHAYPRPNHHFAYPAYYVLSFE
ncbi:MAG: hypothetical protein CK425_07850 [Parachlamydia sp.]|nr:MAG: hypothetical protein CK425_07850 [Parachlamydia sp.]